MSDPREFTDTSAWQWLWDRLLLPEDELSEQPDADIVREIEGSKRGQLSDLSR